MNFMKSTYTRKVGSAAAPGLYIELKEPSWYASFDVDIVGEVYNGLAAHGLETI